MTHKRKPLTLTAKVEAFMANAICPKCLKPYNGDVEFDHEIALAEGGKDHDEVALVPLHKDCHALKYAADRKRIAKVKRNGAKHEDHLTRMNGETPPVRRKKAKMQSRGFQKPPQGYVSPLSKKRKSK